MLTNSDTILILLAGGKSSRAEQNKGLRVVNNNFWIDVVLQHYQQMGLTNLFVGLGYNNKQYLKNSSFLKASQAKYLINENPVDGSFSTLQTILGKALKHQWKFALVFHIDCALASESTIKPLLQENKFTVVKPTFNNKSGHPIKLSRDFCEQLILKPKQSQLDLEMKKINKSQICWQKVDDDSIHYNLNTEEAWKEYIERIKRAEFLT